MSFAFFGARSLSRREAHARSSNGDTRQDGECASVRTVNDESNHSRMNGRSYTLEVNSILKVRDFSVLLGFFNTTRNIYKLMIRVDRCQYY